MCTFITLIAASEDLDRINDLLATLDRRGHARRTERVDTPVLRPLLTAEEREYLLTRGSCDCGTYLGHALSATSDPRAARETDIDRYRRKGWSEARIARAIADKDRAAARAPRRPPNEDATYWIEVMTLLAHGLGVSRLGIMHHFYRRFPGQEPDTATRRYAGAVQEATEVLAVMADGVIHDFRIDI